MKIPRLNFRLSNVWFPVLLVILLGAASFFCTIGIRNAVAEVNHSVSDASPEASPASPANAAANETERTSKPLFIIRAYDGKLAIYKNGDASPFEVLDVYIFTLPEHDRKLLNAGIGVDSTDELRSIIEDYTG